MGKKKDKRRAQEAVLANARTPGQTQTRAGKGLGARWRWGPEVWVSGQIQDGPAGAPSRRYPPHEVKGREGPGRDLIPGGALVPLAPEHQRA